MTYAAESPFENRRRFRQAIIERDIAELSQVRSKNRWDDAPLTVNAFYSPADNKFVLLMGILQAPFYDSKSAASSNIGAIGSVIGHELGHAIDDQGSEFDADGSQRAWMTKKDLENFRKRTTFLVAQFNSIGHDGKLTLGENIGDLVGLTAAYDAAFPQEMKTTQTEKKDFFTAYARNWCVVLRPELEKLLTKTDPHAMGYARINEQVIHQHAFYEAFGYKKGDKMFLPPEKRIQVW